uniref:ATP-binding protein n=1 Tax=Streptomyces graminilatus TaxID=1464070 RepID=UPI000A5081D1
GGGGSGGVDAYGRPVLLALTGDGGIGKSVLLGQLLQRLEPGKGAVALLSCAQLPPDTLRHGFESADRAIGEAVRPGGGKGIIDLLARLRAAYGEVTLLVDTLDLVLDAGTLPGLSSVLGAALELGNVVMTCRDLEYRGHLRYPDRSAPRLAGRLVEHPMPLLSETEIVDWAQHHLLRGAAGSGGLTPSDQAFLSVLRGRVAVPGALRRICALPVRLAMACEVYANKGYIPEELTTKQLFGDYWQARIRTSGGLPAPDKERAVYALAELLLTREGVLRVQVPKGELDRRLSEDRALAEGMAQAVSEGLVLDGETYWEFFHQSFGEYAHARWLLRQGTHSVAITELVRALNSGHSNLWPLATSLLSQVASYDDFRELAGRLPADTTEAARTQVVTSLGRAEEDSLAGVLERVGSSPTLMRRVALDLGEAPARHLLAAHNALVKAVGDHPVGLAGPVANALAKLLARTPEDLLPARLGEALTAVCAARQHHDQAGQVVWQNHPQRLLTALPGIEEQGLEPDPGTTRQEVPDEVLAVLREHYPRLGDLARRTAVLAHLHGPLSAEQTAEFAASVLTVACPPSLGDDDAVRTMRLFWECPAVREQQGWSTWRQLLAAKLPGTWDNAQVRLVARLGAADPDVRTGVVSDILERGTEMTRHVNVLGHLTAEHAEWLAEQLLAKDFKDPRSSEGLSSIAYCLQNAVLLPETRLRLLRALDAVRTAAPRNVWPAQVLLAGDLVEEHVRILNDLDQYQHQHEGMRPARREDAPVRTSAADTAGAGPSLRTDEAAEAAGVAPHVVHSMLKSWANSGSTTVLTAIVDRLRGLMTGPGGANRANGAKGRNSEIVQTRAKLESRLVHLDETARAWLSAALNGESPAVAGTAVKTLQELEDLPWGELTPWLCELLRSPHTDAAMRLTKILLDPSRVVDAVFTEHAIPLLGTATARMRRAVANDEDSNLIRNLLKLVIRVDEHATLGRDEVMEVYKITRSRLPDAPQDPGSASAVPGSAAPSAERERVRERSGWYSAALQDVSTMCGALLGTRLSRPEIRGLLTELLTAMPEQIVSGTVRKRATTLLKGVGHRDPEGLDWLDGLFVRTDLALGIKYAIADAVLAIDGIRRDGRAEGLLTLPGGPSDLGDLGDLGDHIRYELRNCD